MGEDNSELRKRKAVEYFSIGNRDNNHSLSFILREGERLTGKNLSYHQNPQVENHSNKNFSKLHLLI